MVGALEETNYLINLWKFDSLNLKCCCACFDSTGRAIACHLSCGVGGGGGGGGCPTPVTACGAGGLPQTRASTAVAEGLCRESRRWQAGGGVVLGRLLASSGFDVLIGVISGVDYTSDAQTSTSPPETRRASERGRAGPSRLLSPPPPFSVLLPSLLPPLRRPPPAARTSKALLCVRTPFPPVTGLRDSESHTGEQRRSFPRSRPGPMESVTPLSSVLCSRGGRGVWGPVGPGGLCLRWLAEGSPGHAVSAGRTAHAGGGRTPPRVASSARRARAQLLGTEAGQLGPAEARAGFLILGARCRPGWAQADGARLAGPSAGMCTCSPDLGVSSLGRGRVGAGRAG